MVEADEPVVPFGLRVLGEPTTDYPFCCCLGTQYDDTTPVDWTCSGVLILPNVVLTAAHCGRDLNRVLVGACAIPGVGQHEHNAIDGEVFRLRERPVLCHHPSAGSDDLLLLILDRASSVPYAKLASTDQLLASDRCEVVGFGYRDDGDPSSFGTKRSAVVPICAQTLWEFNAPELPRLVEEKDFQPQVEFVAGRTLLGKDTCAGDSGGPALLPIGQTAYLAGITSRAVKDRHRPCGDGGVYLRVDAYVHLIRFLLSEHEIVCDGM